MRPEIAASVSTRVVSWKLAAEMNESVESDALVIPKQQRLADGGLSLLIANTSVLVLVTESVDLFLEQELGVADLLDLDPAEHLANDHLDVLVVDIHTLQAIDLLDLVHEIILQRLHTEYAKISCGFRGRP